MPKTLLCLIVFVLLLSILIPVLVFVWQFRNSPISMDPTDWSSFGQYIGGVSQTISAIFVLISVFLIWQQLRLSNRTAQAEAYFRAHDYLQQEEIREARGELLNFWKTCARWSDFKSWETRERANAERVCNRFNLVGKLIRKQILDPDLIIPAFHFTIEECWEAAQPILKEYRATKSKDWWENFVWLHEQTKKAYPVPDVDSVEVQGAGK